MEKKCSKCGVVIPEEDITCSNCGELWDEVKKIGKVSLDMILSSSLSPAVPQNAQFITAYSARGENLDPKLDGFTKGTISLLATGMIFVNYDLLKVYKTAATLNMASGTLGWLYQKAKSGSEPPLEELMKDPSSYFIPWNEVSNIELKESESGVFGRGTKFFAVITQIKDDQTLKYSISAPDSKKPYVVPPVIMSARAQGLFLDLEYLKMGADAPTMEQKMDAIKNLKSDDQKKEAVNTLYDVALKKHGSSVKGINDEFNSKFLLFGKKEAAKAHAFVDKHK